MVEAAVMAEHYGLREEERARKARHAQSAEFRETIGVTLEPTAELGSRARLQAQNTATSASGMLGKESEVAAASEQYPIALRDDATTAAGRIRAVGGTRPGERRGGKAWGRTLRIS